MSSFAGFQNGKLRTNLIQPSQGLVYGNGLTAHATSVAYAEYTSPLPSIVSSTTYVSRSCNNIAIGNRVYLDIYINFSSTSATGNLYINANIFPALSAQTMVFPCITQNIPWPNNQGTQLYAEWNPGLNHIEIWCQNDTNSPALLQCPTGTGNYIIQISGNALTIV